ncbi:hypothetical protein PN498_17150 [Oscillatoria sp. CS-180]|uniref:hypothetical protein n=1 Tax=Oscillatoria sp. CS-180 TaxID=3021720 RepID=UPI00232EF957|nr:hypothetical protein [Oscillatoria sp. CS-180]MDB9527725.1 hypothetical protein [Oscillatoria sp. CS-180]
MALPLKDILSALVRDIDRASVSADINRAHWQRVYDSSELLRDAVPSHVRVVEAKISLPVAFEAVVEGQVQDYGLTPRQISNILPSEIPKATRDRLARLLHSRLVQEKQNQLLNDDLPQQLRKLIEAVDPEIIRGEEERIENEVIKLQRDFQSKPARNQETQCIYRAEELSKVNPQYIVRLDLTLEIS